MAAHSSSTAVVTPVLPDQPATGWGAWLREIAGSLNALAAWANQPVLPGTTFATLPTAPAAGTIARISDGSGGGWGTVAAGGGTTPTLIWFNGTQWKVFGV